MKFEIREYTEFKENEIVGLYQSVGWTNYLERVDLLRKGYKHSLCILGAYDEEKLVGIIRAVGDNATILFIQDLLVLPEYQRKGIGTKLIQAILEKYKDVYQIELLTDNSEKVVSFYRLVGLIPTSEIGALSFIKM